MTSLILRDGVNCSFEKLFHRAISLADAERSMQMTQATRRKKPAPRYWQDAYRSGNYPEITLLSAIMFEFDMPFGAYVLTQNTDEVLEIIPWLYSSKMSREAFVLSIFEAEAEPDDLRSHARTLSLTADFIEWVTEFNNKRK